MNPKEFCSSRREFLIKTGAVLGGVVGSPLVAVRAAEGLSGGGTKPNSKVKGVQIGLNVPYSFGEMAMSGEDILKRCVELGISGVELRTQPVEVFLGAPKEWVNPPKGATKEAKAGMAKDLAAWRKSAPVGRVKDFRRMYEEGGVRIEIVKVDGIFTMSDEELDYEFALAKALGGRAISTEISTNEADLKRVGSFADKHALMVGYHGHATTRPEDWEKAFAQAKFNGANVDLGHFVAGNNVSPAGFIQKYHQRVTHVHVKDRKRNNGPNTVFGEGDTPIKEVLQLIRDNKWKIQATIEFEYKVPEGSDRMKEIAKCVQYCREALA
jgi:sugar phosphate isomerase/epimerase